MGMRERPVPIELRSRNLAVDRAALRRLVRRILEAEAAPEGRGLGVLVVGDRRMRELNLRWRGKDRTTDVLSFAEAPDWLPLEGEPEPLLGSVVVSAPVCLAQAKDQGVAPGVEFVRLVVHGVLHVLGHDHEKARDRARMVPRERKHRSWAARERVGRGLLTVRR